MNELNSNNYIPNHHISYITTKGCKLKFKYDYRKERICVDNEYTTILDYYTRGIDYDTIIDYMVFKLKHYFFPEENFEKIITSIIYKILHTNIGYEGKYFNPTFTSPTPLINYMNMIPKETNKIKKIKLLL